MDFLSGLGQQLIDVWRRSTTVYRIAMVGLSLLALLVVLGVGWWSSRPQYVTLAGDLKPGDAAEIVSKLEAAGVPYRLDFAASRVSVPKQRWNDARLASAELLGSSVPQEPSLQSSVLDDPTMNQHRVNIEKERALERVVMKMSSVSSADVHIAVPEWTPFQRDRHEVTASVVLGLRRTARFTPEQAGAIAALVAGSVQGLSPDRVTVTDLEGHVLHGPDSANNGAYVRQLEIKQEVESHLASKAEAVLTTMLGPGRAMVRVSADVEMNESTVTEETPLPETKVAKRETVESTSETGGSSTAGAGPAGVASNLAGGHAAARTGGTGRKMETEKLETDYLVGVTQDMRTLRRLDIKRLTIAATVDLPDADPNVTPPVSPITVSDVEELIKTAVGYDANRLDEIKVVEAPMSNPADGTQQVLDTLNRWDFYNNLVRNASLGVAAVTALILGILLMRKMKPITIPDRSGYNTADRMTVISELSRQAQENPEMVSRIVNAWLSADPAANAGAPTPNQNSTKASKSAAA